MATRAVVTLEEIADANAARLQRLGIAADSLTVEASLIQMVSAVGDLATLSYRSPASLSLFEKEEVASVLGRLTVALSTVGHCLEVDVGSAALAYLEQSRPYPTAGSTPRDRSECQATHNSHPQQQQQQHPVVVLSPSSRDSFFTHLDALVGAPRATVEAARLLWVAPNDTGALEEMIPNGAETVVSFEQFPVYYSFVQARRPNSTPWLGVGGPHFDAHARAMAGPPITMQAPGYDPEAEAKLFSPTHFSQGLFSPRADAAPSELLRAKVRPPSALKATPLDQPFTTSSSAPGSAEAVRQSSSRSQSQMQPPPRPPMNEKEFELMVGYIRGGTVRGPQVADLGLTFCMMDGERVVELVQDGMQIMVTAANAGEFLRLLDEARRATPPPPPERIHRVDSIRRLQAMPTPPEAGANGFSPSHFSHGLFAPHTDKATFYVDYDASERTLPPFLKQKAQPNPHPQQQQQFRAPSEDAACGGGQRYGSAAGNGAEAQLRARRDSIYMSAVRACDWHTLSRIIDEVEASRRALSVYGVTFCVPGDGSRGLHEMYPGSAARVVERDEQAIFLAFARRSAPPLA